MHRISISTIRMQNYPLITEGFAFDLKEQPRAAELLKLSSLTPIPIPYENLLLDYIHSYHKTNKPEVLNYDQLMHIRSVINVD